MNQIINYLAFEITPFFEDIPQVDAASGFEAIPQCFQVVRAPATTAKEASARRAAQSPPTRTKLPTSLGCLTPWLSSRSWAGRLFERLRISTALLFHIEMDHPRPFDGGPQCPNGPPERHPSLILFKEVLGHTG